MYDYLVEYGKWFAEQTCSFFNSISISATMFNYILHVYKVRFLYTIPNYTSFGGSNSTKCKMVYRRIIDSSIHHLIFCKLGWAEISRRELENAEYFLGS